MNVFHSTLRIILTLVSVSLIVLVTLAVVPATTGGLNLSADHNLNAELEGGIYYRVTGQYTVTSSMPYDLTDVNLSFCMTSADGSMSEELYDGGTFDISRNSSHIISIDARVFIPSVLMLIATNHKNLEYGICVPVVIGIEGKYMQKMMDIKICLDADIKIIEKGTADKTTVTKTTTGNVIGISGGMSNMEGIAAKLMPEIEMKFIGTDVAFKTETHENLEHLYDAKFTIESTAGDILAQLKSVENKMYISVTINGTSLPMPVNVTSYANLIIGLLNNMADEKS